MAYLQAISLSTCGFESADETRNKKTYKFFLYVSAVFVLIIVSHQLLSAVTLQSYVLLF